MKAIQIEVIINEDKIATAFKTKGFINNLGVIDMSGRLEIIGILENLKQNQLSKLENLNKEVR